MSLSESLETSEIPNSNSWIDDNGVIEMSKLVQEKEKKDKSWLHYLLVAFNSCLWIDEVLLHYFTNDESYFLYYGQLLVSEVFIVFIWWCIRGKPGERHKQITNFVSGWTILSSGGICFIKVFNFDDVADNNLKKYQIRYFMFIAVEIVCIGFELGIFSVFYLHRNRKVEEEGGHLEMLTKAKVVSSYSQI